MDHPLGEYAVRMGNEKGIALVTVFVILASMAVLMSGVYYLITGSTRSAARHTSFQSAQTSGESGLGQLASLIDRVAVSGFNPPAPPGYGVNVSQWGSLQIFGDYIRDDADRPVGWTCSQASPDINYTVTTPEGSYAVDACVKRISAGGIAGSGKGLEFLRTSSGSADNESLFEVTVWVTGPDGEARSERQASIRAFY